MTGQEILSMTDGELKTLAHELGGAELVDRIYAEATEHASRYLTDDAGAAAYLTAWRLRVLDAQRRAQRPTMPMRRSRAVLIWVPEFYDPVEIPLGEPIVHNEQDGRFTLEHRDVPLETDDQERR